MWVVSSCVRGRSSRVPPAPPPASPAGCTAPVASSKRCSWLPCLTKRSRGTGRWSAVYSAAPSHRAISAALGRVADMSTSCRGGNARLAAPPLPAPPPADDWSGVASWPPAAPPKGESPVAAKRSLAINNSSRCPRAGSPSMCTSSTATSPTSDILPSATSLLSIRWAFSSVHTATWQPSRPADRREPWQASTRTDCGAADRRRLPGRLGGASAMGDSTRASLAATSSTSDTKGRMISAFLPRCTSMRAKSSSATSDLPPEVGLVYTIDRP
eukprot:scaffold12001_cov116-Isochrysis_galbana.AAC.19